ncbi:MAG: hypothetical protein HYR96_14440 [Deltaproteobacteria bacterium]|nr:hypothetical protein [Deltaproteobacteria bacterium]MBI3296348.1 hypothetical protein [Deltaproteobacteria bacterium]
MFVLSGIALGSGLDYNVSLGARLLPRGAGIQAVVGYNHLVWGDRKDDKSFLFGFLRPSVVANTSVVNNRLSGIIDLFPISLFGVSLGYYVSQRGTNIDTLDCSVIQCRGSVYGGFLKTKLMAAYKRVFFVAHYSLQSLGSEDRSLPLGDEFTALIADSGGDRLENGELTVGLKFPETTFGVIVGASRYLTLHNSSTNQSLFFRYSTGPWAFITGVGTFSSTHHPNSGLNTFAFVKWNGAPSLGD